MPKADNLGKPIRMVAIYAAAYGKENGEDRIFAVSSGTPCVLFVIDPQHHTCVRRIPMETTRHSWGVVAATDGNIYMGGDGRLYRYIPGNDAVDELGVPIEGETYFWRLAAHPNGKVYGGTFPGGKVFEYDPATQQFRDFGTIENASQYVRSMDAYGEELFAGLGVVKASVFRLNTVTGEKREIPLPEEARADTTVYDLNVVDDKLFVRTTPSNHLWVYDLKAERWVDRIDQGTGLDISPLQPGEPYVYFVRNEKLCAYHIHACKLTELPVPVGDSAKGFGWIELRDDPDFPGSSLVSMKKNGDFWFYNPVTQKYRTVSLPLEGQPIMIQSMIRGPEGDIHMGGYLAGGFARYSPNTGKITSYKGIGQIEGMVSHQGSIYMGVYTKAKIYKYDPDRPWEEHQNPKLLFSLQKHRQDRPYAFASAGDEVAIGTTPDYGQLGGALTLYNPKTGTHEVYEHIVQNQSVITLAYRDGLLYGGTCVWGGLGVPPVELEGKLFVWDLRTRKKRYEIVPVPGERAVSALVFDEEGLIWGLTAGCLFQFDPEAQQTVKVISLFDFDWSETEFFSRGGFLEYIGDGRLIGTTLGKLFLFDTVSGKLRVLSDNNALFAFDNEGHLYFNKQDDLLRMDRSHLAAPME